MESRLYDFRFKTFDGNMLFQDFLLAGFRAMLNFIIQNLRPDDIIGIKIEIGNDESKPIGLSFRPVSQLAPEMILDLIESVSQSNSLYSVTDRLIITATTITLPDGGVIVNLSHCSDMQVLQRKASSILHTGPTNDNLCLPKAIMLGKYYVDNNGGRLHHFLNPLHNA